jgi:hypothetical protein
LSGCRQHLATNEDGGEEDIEEENRREMISLDGPSVAEVSDGLSLSRVSLSVCLGPYSGRQPDSAGQSA